MEERAVMKKYSFIIVLIVVALILGVVRLLNKPNVSLYTVKKETIINTLEVTGTYSIASQTPVMSPTNGIITKVFVSDGDVVKKGDPLFYVESSASETQKRAALAGYLAAKAALDADNAQLYALQSAMFSAWKTYTDIAENSTYQNSDGNPNTGNRILTQFTTVQDDWLAAEASYKNEQSVIAKDQAAVASTLEQYNETQSVTVPSPISGTVVNFLSQAGDQVEATTPSTDGQTTNPPVLLIANFGSPTITVSVSEENIPKVQIGDSATIVFDAFPGKSFTGRVSGIDIVGTNKEGIISYNVRIKIDNLSQDVRPNMTANITIETARRNNVLTIPNSSIVEKDGKTFVQKEGNDQNHLSGVTIGLKGLTKTEITGGLALGDRIVLPK